MKKLIIILFLFIPVFVFAQVDEMPEDVFFKAEVIQVIEQQKTILPDGTETEQQNLLLRGLEGDFKDKEIKETKQIKIPARAVRRHKTMIRVARGWMALAKNN